MPKQYKEPMVVRTFRLPPSSVIKLEDRAVTLKMTPSEIMRNLINDWLK